MLKWNAAKVQCIQAKLLYWKQHNNFSPGKGKALKMCPEPVHTASPESKECVVPPVLAPGASADGGAARARPRHVLRRPRSLPERVRMGEQRAPESPIQGISINRTNIVKSRDTTQRFLPFHPASVIARGSRPTRAALAHTPASAARLGGGGGGRGGASRQR